MKKRTKEFHLKLLIFIVLIIASLSLTACSSATQESSPDIGEEQQTEIMLPVVGSDAEESIDTGADGNAYPATEREAEYQEVDELNQDEVYPEPELDTVSQMDAGDSQGEADPDPQEEPAQVLKPTPRGNELVASDPSTVNLASGNLQLVELFAFW